MFSTEYHQFTFPRGVVSTITTFYPVLVCLEPRLVGSSKLFSPCRSLNTIHILANLRHRCLEHAPLRLFHVRVASTWANALHTVPASNIVPQTLYHCQMVLNIVPRLLKSHHNVVNILPGVHLSGMSEDTSGTRGYLYVNRQFARRRVHPFSQNRVLPENNCTAHNFVLDRIKLRQQEKHQVVQYLELYGNSDSPLLNSNTR